jgi:hypothetical protein
MRKKFSSARQTQLATNTYPENATIEESTQLFEAVSALVLTQSHAWVGGRNVVDSRVEVAVEAGFWFL